ncbi:uncharacterized protein LOC116337202 [Contarinia nasturtii]|uniref:uncharacterized protein LOC116337202 n=1 Tax=Contarinia nasturtii TaxID=265458 RepID=UPI0012D4B134|nr:uncharacterized protein LOC116337202 [Contarinia nasturtii]
MNICIFIILFAINLGFVLSETSVIVVINHNTCCKVEKFLIDKFEADVTPVYKQFLNECLEELNLTDVEKIELGKSSACIIECIGLKANIITANKRMNETGFRNVVNEIPLEEHQKAVAEETITKCMEKVRSLPEIVINGCTTMTIRADHCIAMEFFKSCPVEKQDTSKICVDLREHINKM